MHSENVSFQTMTCSHSHNNDA